MAGEFADTGTQDKDEALADAARWDFDEDEMQALRDALGFTPAGRLWADHLTAFEALTAAGSSWRTRLVMTDDGLRERIAGLDYAALAVPLQILGIVLTPADWDALRVLEDEARRAMNGEGPRFVDAQRDQVSDRAGA